MGQGKGAVVAAWKQAARAELAKTHGLFYAQVLLDLVKAFETVHHHILLQCARDKGYNLTIQESSERLLAL